MGLPRSSYYYQPKKPSPEEQELGWRLEALTEEFGGYGYRRITRQLQREGRPINHKKVLRLMRERGLLCKRRRAWVRTTDSRHRYPVYPNLLPAQRVTALNQVWAADITYIRLAGSFVYLAVILDLFSRRVIGYGLSRGLDATLSLQALTMALKSRKPPSGVVHHSDRGVQYAAYDYVNTLLTHGFKISMARRGNPYDNAAMESFFKTLKTEEVYLWNYQTIEDAKKRLPYFLEEVYNRKRLHSALGYCPPLEFEARCHNPKNQPQTLHPLITPFV